MGIKLDLQFFAESEEETFDLDSFKQEFEAEWNETDGQAIEDNQEEVSGTEEKSLEGEETDEQETETQSNDEEQEDLDPNASEEQKRNQAFQAMRQKAQENEKAAGLVKKIAEANGITVEEVMQRFEEQQLQKQAQDQNVPVDVIKRLNTLEQENQKLTQQTKAEKFDSQVKSTIDKYGLKNDDVQNVFKYMADNGYVRQNDLPSISFEDAYFLANRDTIIEKQVEQARQKELEEKQKRQQSSAIPGGNSVSQTDEWTDDAVLKELEKRGISI